MEKISIEDAVMVILGNSPEPVPGQTIRQRLQIYKWCRGAVDLYHMMARLEDQGLVERVINNKVVEGYEIKEHCFRLRTPV